MFFRWKKTEQESEDNKWKEIKKKLDSLLEELKEGKKTLIQNEVKEKEWFEEIKKELKEEWKKEIQGLGTEVRKHNMTLEDTLDELEQQSEEETESRKQLRQIEKERDQLLGLVGAYEEQIWSMRNFVGEQNEMFLNQMKLMERVLQGNRMPCGITLIAEMEGQVDYRLYEVIEAVDTTEAEKDRTIARIYSPGYLYHGKVIRKAKVAAYRVVS